ncbi:MAG: hypothetical protein NTW86_00245 [Candidatus Sumerlaeota bacterium]|nr:hypothetical protein [Candidatus Sumerlaeota bacterium]
MGRGRERDESKESYWREQVTRQAASGESARGYCTAAGLSESRFHWWRREIRARDEGRLGPSERVSAPIRLAEVIVASAAAPVGPWSGVEVALPDTGLAVRLAVGFDEGTLRRALAALSGESGC